MQFDVAAEEIPEEARSLSPIQRTFLGELVKALDGIHWQVEAAADMLLALRIHKCFHDTRARVGLPLRDALLALFACLFDRPFTYQAAMAIYRQPKPFVLDRIGQVARGNA
jgi:hypothetical protein